MPHFVTFDRFLAVECTEPETATCRNGCGEPCAAWENGDGCDHPKTQPLPYCNVVEWIESDGAIDCYDGEASIQRLPIATRWDGDQYVWAIDYSRVQVSA